MKLLGSKLFGWFPATFIVSLFGLGYTHWCREAWLAILAGITVFLCGYFITPLVELHNPTIIDYGVALMRSSMVLLFAGWFALAVFEAQRGGDSDIVVIDYFWGIFFTLTLLQPSITYAAKSFSRITDYLCTKFMHCFQGVEYLPYLTAFAIPCVIYPLMGKWEVWPMLWIKEEFRSSLRNFLVELVKVIYTTLIFSTITFFFMKGDFTVIWHYWEMLFMRILPDSWMSEIKTLL